MAERRSYMSRKDDGKSTILLIGVLLVLIVLVGAGLLAIIQGKAPAEAPPVRNETPSPPPENLTNVTEACDEQCMLEEAVETKNLTICEGLTELQQSCYEQLAADSPAACGLVADAPKKQDCITAFAVADGNITICDSLDGDAKEACRLAVDPCAEADEYGLCTALESDDPSLCEGETECLVDYSMYKGTTSSCDLIENRVVATACRSAVLNSDKCYDLGPGSLRDYCYELFAIYSGDYLTCTQTTPNSLYALDCFSLYAAHEGNYTRCDDDGFELNNRWLCYTNYSLLTGDTSGCEAIHQLATTHKFACVFEFAKLYGDPSACDIIENAGSRSTCYQGSILYSNDNLDWHNCADIPNYDWRLRCYAEAAIMEGDITICDRMDGEQTARDSCRSIYGS